MSPDRRVIAAAIAVPVLAVVVLVGVSVIGGDDERAAPETTTTTASAPQARIDDPWNDALAAAVAPIGESLPALAAGVDQWSTGGIDDAGLAALLDRVGPMIEAVAGDAAALPPHPDDPLAQPLVERSTELYVLSVDAHRAVLDLDDPDLRREHDRLGRRLRILGDRTFDRARERTAAPVDPGPNVDLVLPSEVPDWTRLELAAGPPLEATDPNVTDEEPLARTDERANQAADDWLEAVEALDVPTVDGVLGAFGDPGQLGALARAAVSAAEELRTIPVPAGDRGRADRVGLGWLLRADGARAAQLADLSGREATLTLAERILAVGADRVFDPAVG